MDSVQASQQEQSDLEAGADILRCLRGASWSGEGTPSPTGRKRALSPEPSPSATESDEDDMPAAKRVRTSSKAAAARRIPSRRDQDHLAEEPEPSALQGHGKRARSLMHVDTPPKHDMPAQRQHFSSGPQSKAAADHKEADRDWAALTTWLRMNLHHPRTAKKAVLFVGHYDTSRERWYFGLHKVFKWDDLSPETKTRLRSLPAQAEGAFAQKYPKRLSSEWRQKTQKYKKGDDPRCYQVPLGHLVDGLHQIHQEHAVAEETILAQQKILAHNWRAVTAVDSHYRPVAPMRSGFSAYQAWS